MSSTIYGADVYQIFRYILSVQRTLWSLLKTLGSSISTYLIYGSMTSALYRDWDNLGNTIFRPVWVKTPVKQKHLLTDPRRDLSHLFAALDSTDQFAANFRFWRERHTSVSCYIRQCLLDITRVLFFFVSSLFRTIDSQWQFNCVLFYVYFLSQIRFFVLRRPTPGLLAMPISRKTGLISPNALYAK